MSKHSVDVQIVSILTHLLINDHANLLPSQHIHHASRHDVTIECTIYPGTYLRREKQPLPRPSQLYGIAMPKDLNRIH